MGELDAESSGVLLETNERLSLAKSHAFLPLTRGGTLDIIEGLQKKGCDLLPLAACAHTCLGTCIIQRDFWGERKRSYVNSKL